MRIFDCREMLRQGQSGPAGGSLPSDSQALAALGTAGIDDLAAILRFLGWKVLFIVGSS